MPFTVQKRDHHGNVKLSYEGEVLERSAIHVCLVATFARDDVDAGYVVFRRGDVMTEWFYTDRWYNVFRLQDVATGALKGWYCNITRPAVIGETSLYADDLALDVFVSPQGDIIVLDEDEFAALDLSADDHAEALAAVDALRGVVACREGTFGEISNSSVS